MSFVWYVARTLGRDIFHERMNIAEYILIRVDQITKEHKKLHTCQKENWQIFY